MGEMKGFVSCDRGNCDKLTHASKPGQMGGGDSDAEDTSKRYRETVLQLLKKRKTQRVRHESPWLGFKTGKGHQRNARGEA